MKTFLVRNAIPLLTLLAIVMSIYSGILGFRYWWPCTLFTGISGICLDLWLGPRIRSKSAENRDGGN